MYICIERCLFLWKVTAWARQNALPYYSTTVAWAVDREFVKMYLVPLDSFGCLWACFGPTSCSSRCPWVPLAILWDPFGQSFSVSGFFGLPLSISGMPLAFFGPDFV